MPTLNWIGKDAVVKRYEVYVTPAAWRETRDLPGYVTQRVRRAVEEVWRKGIEARRAAHESGRDKGLCVPTCWSSAGSCFGVWCHCLK
jgi:hypothetical protein